MARTNSQIESTIEQMEELIERSKPVFLSSTNISVDREELEELIKQLRLNLPEEIERYRKVISNKEAIERSAQEEADRMLAQVRQQANEILSESEIMSRAQKQADDMVAAAAAEANRIVEEAQYQGDRYMAASQKYLSDMLQSLNSMIYDCIDNASRNTNRLLDSLNEVGQTVQENLNELSGQPVQEAAPAPVQDMQPVDSQGMYDTGSLNDNGGQD
ncbi:MAG: vacuolar family H+-ATPase subunit H [Lachnospiraceae bacterium]|nr:vacuolar family H+-ATPase subunit H [Lachnospiraceae bacterium]